MKKFNLLVASYLFYAAWRPPFVVILWISTLVDWFAGKGIGASQRQAARRAWLLLSLGANFGLLGFFKYGKFLDESFVAALGFFGVRFQPVLPDIILPVGISFYTFQTLSYTIDIYRGKAQPWHSFLDYALYVTFFPQLVAGPIVRATQFLPQCEQPKRASARQMSWGLSLMLLGLFEKIVIADGILARITERVYDQTLRPCFTDAWCGTMSFAAQIFCDFAGYSTCAIGVGLCFGFALPDNFHFPYASIGLSDFWRRWHISLSTWLRDYLYIPLGGSRDGAIRTLRNLTVTMLLGGLWHGASWTFVFWGGLHGMFLVVEYVVTTIVRESDFWLKLPVRIALAFVTYLLCCVAWVFFRAHSFGQAFTLLGSMLHVLPTEGPGVLDRARIAAVLGITIAMLGIHWVMRDSSLEEIANRCPWWLKGLILAGLMIAIMTVSGEDRAFIYFQF
ncbi:MAG: MBOAT family O-acyltransferase [Planctomycetota bacterium]